mgnify:FL=1|tara:strand:- start:2816 stop:2989 length:174 start_codon:yes stop_codon:yes gene_type:complete
MNVELDTTYLVWVGLVFLIFVLREVNCWYWKVNKSVDIQQKILDELVELNKGEEANE